MLKNTVFCYHHGHTKKRKRNTTKTSNIPSNTFGSCNFDAQAPWRRVQTIRINKPLHSLCEFSRHSEPRSIFDSIVAPTRGTPCKPRSRTQMYGGADDATGARRLKDLHFGHEILFCRSLSRNRMVLSRILVRETVRVANRRGGSDFRSFKWRATL